MALKLVEEKLASERFVYEALRRGDTDTVCYRAERNSQWGVRDGNYTNRLRLGYCLWHFGVADEAAVAYLFEEELLEACFELTAQAPAETNDLWLWAKQTLTNDFTMRYGNLYTKALAAAQAMKDPFAATLTQQYQAWLAQNHYPKEGEAYDTSAKKH